MGKRQEIMREQKRARFSEGKKQRNFPTQLVVAVVCVLLVALLAVVAWPRSGDAATTDGAASAGQVTTAEDGAIRFPLSTFDDGQARFYTFEVDGVSIEYFVLKSSDGVVRAAFNACDVCYGARLGYRQEGDEMVCNNCGQRFPSNMINEVRGGCNPSPLGRAVEGDELVIQIDDLLTGIGFFR